ncbi:M28 family peptidase, partial [uncultured Acidaminococcus sp.]
MDTMDYLCKIGQFGKNPDGSYTRRIFSPEWEGAADLVRNEMRALSMKTDRDAAGNEHGVLLGSVPGLPAIILGSHLDTVPSGGLYDGAMGVAAALAALSRAQKEGVVFRHPMEIYAFNGEEFNPLGALFGSRV